MAEAQAIGNVREILPPEKKEHTLHTKIADASLSWIKLFSITDATANGVEGPAWFSFSITMVGGSMVGSVVNDS